MDGGNEGRTQREGERGGEKVMWGKGGLDGRWSKGEGRWKSGRVHEGERVNRKWKLVSVRENGIKKRAREEKKNHIYLYVKKKYMMSGKNKKTYIKNTRKILIMRGRGKIRFLHYKFSNCYYRLILFLYE